MPRLKGNLIRKLNWRHEIKPEMNFQRKFRLARETTPVMVASSEYVSGGTDEYDLENRTDEWP